MPEKHFKSRIGLIENLRNHLLAGRSAAMIGGPKIGKSALAEALADRINRRGARAVRVDLQSIENPPDLWSLFFDETLRQGVRPARSPFKKSPASLPDLMFQLHHLYEKAPAETASRPIILLLDNADRILSFPTNPIPQIINLTQESISPSIQAICWIGGMAWGDWIQTDPDDFKRSLRLYPLSAIPIREARAIIQNHLGPDMGREEVDRIWNETGGHPLLLEKALGNNAGPEPAELARALWREVRPEEEAILHRLDPAGGWIELDALREENGERPPKARLDRLCALGLVVRTLRDGTAAVRLTSPLFTKVRQT